ncbi:hypothetical protein K449DRAFT_432146 [Hypoxylon sp. EC38]|nr:hypothetical protein K449DRAFT_432146 [Hypoxylon sp. EC38]
MEALELMPSSALIFSDSTSDMSKSTPNLSMAASLGRSSISNPPHTRTLKIVDVSPLLSAVQSAILDVFVKVLPSTTPAVDPKDVIYTGAGEIRPAFPSNRAPGALEAYIEGLKITFTRAIAVSRPTFLVSVWDLEENTNRSYARRGLG